MSTSPGYLTTPRGQVAKYLYQRTDLAVTEADDTHDAEATGLQGSDSLDGIAQLTLNNLNNANFKTYGGQVLVYNPITDNYDIKRGEYIL